MKAFKKYLKSIVVICIVGIGLMSNLNYKININDSKPEIYILSEYSKVDTDSIYKENRILNYTKSIIHSGFQHLISRL